MKNKSMIIALFGQTIILFSGVVKAVKDKLGNMPVDRATFRDSAAALNEKIRFGQMSRITGMVLFFFCRRQLAS